MAALFAVSAVASARAEDVRAEPPRQEPPSAVGGCAVTADDGHKFMDSRVASCRDYYYPAHACSTDAGQATPICQRMNTMMGVDLARPDMIIAPHRGVFGMSLPSSSGPPTNPAIALGGPPENSWPGVGEAQGAGFRFIEYDMLLMGDAADPSQPQEVMMTHYTDLRAFTDYAGPQTTPNTGIAPCAGYLMCASPDPVYQLRNRDEVVDRDKDAKLYSLRNFLNNLHVQYARDPKEWNLVLILDMKYGRPLRQLQRTSTGGVGSATIGFDGFFTPEEQQAESLVTLKWAVSTLSDPSLDMASHVIIKVPQETLPDVAGLFAAFREAHLSTDQYLWSPTPDPRPRTPPETVLAWLDSWTTVIDPRQIPYWDTAIPSNKSWMGQAFCWDGKTFGQPSTTPNPCAGKPTFVDLMDYLFKRNGRRSAIWTPDPSGPGGRHGNFAMSWNNSDNTANDFRGDGVSDLYFSGSSHALVTSDRPDLFIQIRQYLNSKPVEGREP